MAKKPEPKKEVEVAKAAQPVLKASVTPVSLEHDQSKLSKEISDHKMHPKFAKFKNQGD